MPGRPSRPELLQGTLDLLILRTLLPGRSFDASWDLSEMGKRARYYRRKHLAAEQSKWEARSRAIGLVFNPAEQEG